MCPLTFTLEAPDEILGCQQILLRLIVLFLFQSGLVAAWGSKVALYECFAERERECLLFYMHVLQNVQLFV